MNQDKPRPFALATPCSAGELGTLVYGSTQETEKSEGAAFFTVAPARAGLSRNGLWSRTYFYPGALLPIAHGELPPHSGFLGRSVDELRAALRVALGIGRGSCLTTSAPEGSYRGRIVVLRSSLARDIRSAFAVVLTEPGYSVQRNYQIILPLIAAFRRKTADRDLLVSSGSWLRVFPRPVECALLPIPTVHSIWHRDDIARETEYVVDDETLHEIDWRLCDYFSLPPADHAG